MKCPYCSNYTCITFIDKDNIYYSCNLCDIGIDTTFTALRFIAIPIKFDVSKKIRTIFDYKDSFFIELYNIYDDFGHSKTIYFDRPLNANSRYEIHKLIPKLENLLILS